MNPTEVCDARTRRHRPRGTRPHADPRRVDGEPRAATIRTGPVSGLRAPVVRHLASVSRRRRSRASCCRGRARRRLRADDASGVARARLRLVELTVELLMGLLLTTLNAVKLSRQMDFSARHPELGGDVLAAVAPRPALVLGELQLGCPSSRRRTSRGSRCRRPRRTDRRSRSSPASLSFQTSQLFLSGAACREGHAAPLDGFPVSAARRGTLEVERSSGPAKSMRPAILRPRAVIR